MEQEDKENIRPRVNGSFRPIWLPSARKSGRICFVCSLYVCLYMSCFVTAGIYMYMYAVCINLQLIY